MRTATTLSAHDSFDSYLIACIVAHLILANVPESIHLVDLTRGAGAYLSNVRDFWIVARDPAVIRLGVTHGVDLVTSSIVYAVGGMFPEHSKVRPTLICHVDIQ